MKPEFLEGSWNHEYFVSLAKFGLHLLCKRPEVFMIPRDEPSKNRIHFLNSFFFIPNHMSMELFMVINYKVPKNVGILNKYEGRFLCS